MVRTAIVRWGIVVLAAGFVVACNDANAVGPEGTPLPVQLVDTLQLPVFSGISEKTRDVIRTEQDWEAFWAQVYGNMSPRPPAPSIDFTSRMVIVAATGTRRSGGFLIRIESVLRNGDGYDVGVLETDPGPSCVVTAGVTAPVTAVVVPVAPGEVHFFERKTVLDCN